MRVITGIARGKKLMEPAGQEIRPTTAMVKEAVFNIIQNDIEGRTVLDLFGGTGQMAIEALSRGAKSAVIVDENTPAVKLIKENLSRTKLEGGTVIQTESLKYLERPEKFDLIFLDPPYNTSFLKKSLQKIVEFDKLNVGGIIICEGPDDKEPNDLDIPYRKIKSNRYGKVRITLFTREEKA